jgi:hypothetical protein
MEPKLDEALQVTLQHDEDLQDSDLLRNLSRTCSSTLKAVSASKSRSSPAQAAACDNSMVHASRLLVSCRTSNVQGSVISDPHPLHLHLLLSLLCRSVA